MAARVESRLFTEYDVANALRMGLDLMDDSELARAAPVGIRGPLSRCLSLSRPWRHETRYVHANFSARVSESSPAATRGRPPAPSQARHVRRVSAVAQTPAAGLPTGLTPQHGLRYTPAEPPSQSDSMSDVSDSDSADDGSAASSQPSSGAPPASPGVLHRIVQRCSRILRRAIRSPRRFASDTDGSADRIDSLSEVTGSDRDQSGAAVAAPPRQSTISQGLQRTSPSGSKHIFDGPGAVA